MSATYYTSLSGMMAASFGLQNTSNNISNMQSPGFKRNDVFYSSLGNGSNQDNPGSGVYVGGRSTNFNPGNYLQSQNASDLAIVGNGFFIIRLKNNELRYTRDGEFTFNKDHLLIDNHSGGLVQGYNASGNLAPISQLGAKTNPGKPTHVIDLKGSFIITELAKDPNSPADPDPQKSKFEPVKFNVDTVYDAKGKAHKVSVEFESPTSSGSYDNLNWNLTAVTIDGVAIAFSQQSLAFNYDSDGTVKMGNNTIKFKLSDEQLVTLNFGNEQSDMNNSVRLWKNEMPNHTNTNIEVTNNDGYSEGTQIGYSFDENGQITYAYDNGQFEEGIYVGLALFDDLEHTLIQSQDNMFRAKTSHGMTIGRPNQQGFGNIQSQKIESSNVDSTIEFANIVVLQRMFQACSQIMDIDKQLLEELEQK